MTPVVFEPAHPSTQAPTRSAGVDVRPFTPVIAGGHWMTLYAWGKPRHFPRLPEPLPRFFDVAPDARVLAHCHWHAHRWQHPTIVLLHGLEGSSSAHYMRGLADKAWATGWNVVRLNQRNCGGTEHLSKGLYHSGLIDDPLRVIRELIEVDGLPTIAVAGYSLGGNLTLRLAGVLGADAPRELIAACAVSPTMDLDVCVSALEQPSNRLYEWNFVRNLKARMRRKAKAYPGDYDLSRLGAVRSVRNFDEAFTAPHHGFRDASDYYYRASAIRVIDRVRIPTLILTAADDPFVPPHPFNQPLVAHHRYVTTVITDHGGHCAFVEASAPGYDGYWAEREVVSFVSRQVGP